MKKEVFTLAEDASHVGSVTDPQSQDISKTNHPSPHPSPIGEGATQFCHCEGVKRPSQSHNSCNMNEITTSNAPHSPRNDTKRTYRPNVLSSYRLKNKFSSPFTLHPSLKQKAAFTLSEVLITLGIIGVVAAITLPSVINDAKGKKLKAQLEKSYSILGQALSSAQNELGYTINYNNTYGNTTFKDTYIKQSANTYDCRNEQTKTCLTDTWRPVEYKTFNGNELYTLRFDDGDFILQDGTFVIMELGDNRMELTVDVNGKNNKPNRWGHDLFTFQIMDNGKLVPMGADGTRTDLCDSKSSSTENGVGCTYKALTDKNYWKQLPH